MTHKQTSKVVVVLLSAGLLFAGLVAGCGKAVPLTWESILGDAVVGDGGTRTDGSDLGAIYPVTTVVSGVSGSPTPIPGWTYNADLPFTSLPALSFNDPTQNRQVPFSFTYTFPPNNYSLYAAHLVIDTSRDTSDTEGIFVDGVVTSRPPGNVSGVSTKITDRHYQGSGNPVNDYYMSFSLAHYLQNTRQTFDLDIENLLTPTATTIYDILSDGFLPVVTSDDSPVYQAFLVMEGYTISKNALVCTNAGPFTFTNEYLHNDGNSVGAQAFSGTMEFPFFSMGSGVAGFKSIEYYFDPFLPRVPVGDVTLSTASISTTVRRNTALSAIVVNGVGVAEPGFDKTTATSEVEMWEDGATATNYWSTLLATIPTTSTDTAITINLNSMFGSAKVKELISQGKLNIALAGGIRSTTASAFTSSRTFGTPVSGPTLTLDGTYLTQVCAIPDDPTSPLQGGGIPPTLPGDTTSPQVISTQATEITSTTASIVWLTDEGSTSQVAYGVGDTATLSALDSTPAVFHKVNLTGLLPYKYYYYAVKSADGNGNLTTTNVKVFRTLR